MTTAPALPVVLPGHAGPGLTEDADELVLLGAQQARQGAERTMGEVRAATKL